MDSVANMRSIVLLAVAIAAFAQIQQANLTGVVNDQSGAVVPGAAVVLENRTTKVKAKTETNAAGVYRLAVVPNPSMCPGERAIPSIEPVKSQ